MRCASADATETPGLIPSESIEAIVLGKEKVKPSSWKSRIHKDAMEDSFVQKRKGEGRLVQILFWPLYCSIIAIVLKEEKVKPSSWKSRIHKDAMED
ncbi:hypothetical protein PoB_000269200 [Plakobranchus ocellatus]|uniref:Uncharacterized protein n=1 Tax=Plakobranchus ocellatus TaxID=259542 RepID=A0AAV3Y095_9GAST|nr:hypothetical protein PoB_000269200 [Plakobranchus ocellatus]